MKIRNINGTFVAECDCASWLDHWKKFSGQATLFCLVNDCFKRDLVGAHVQKGGSSTDQNWYICPLCQIHNSHAGELEVSDLFKLVPASKNETCGK